MTLQEYIASLRGRTVAVIGIGVSNTPLLELLLAGMNNQQIARQLYISVGTVKAHTHNIFAKTGFGDRAQLADAVRQGRNA